MHTQTASASEHRARIVSRLHAAIGFGLYLLTLAGEVVLGAGIRWIFTYLGAAVLGMFVPLWPGAEQLAVFAALAPLAWSLLGLAVPGGGWIWRRRIGARRPSAEEAVAIEDAWAMLAGADPSLPEPGDVHVLDDPIPAGSVRGRTLVLSRGLLETDSVAPVLAHELAHTRSLDGRLTEALARLELWGDPLNPSPQPKGEADRRLGVEEHCRQGFLGSCIRWTLYLAGGGCAERLLSPLWAAHWRAREYAADASAASLGQGEDLARYLADFELQLDPPRRRFPLNLSEHPPVALRIERLAGR